jgi:hypothetical protein
MHRKVRFRFAIAQIQPLARRHDDEASPFSRRLILRKLNGDAAALLATFLLTIFVNLLTGIGAGVAIIVAMHFYQKRFGPA